MGEDTPEVWRPVVGYEGYYEVSNLGRVWSVPRRCWSNPSGGVRQAGGHFMKAGPDRLGYPQVSLWIDGSMQLRKVHWLVCAAFYGPRPEGMVIRHLDGNPANNRLENLRYGTYSENALDKQHHGTDHNASRPHCAQGHPYTEENTLVRVRDGYTSRVCRACAADRLARWKASHAVLTL